MAILDITTYAGPYPSGWGLLDDDAQTINDADTSTLPQARITALKMYETAGAAGGGGGLNEVVDDTTPQLGGNLDVNGNKLVSTSNGDIDIEPNGTGDVLLGNLTFDADQTVGAGQDNYVLTYDNAAGTIGLEASAGGGGGSLQLTEIASFDFGSSPSTSEDIDVTGYDSVEVHCSNISYSASASLRARTSSDGFSSDLGNGASDYIQTQLNDGTNTGAASSFIGLGAVDGTANRHGSGRFSNLSSATHKTSCESYFAAHGNSAAMLRRGFRQTAQVDTHLRITTNVGATINGGTIRVLGVGTTGSSETEVSTTDATVTTCGTIATANDTAYHVKCVVTARETVDSDEVASYELRGTFRNDGGTLTLVGTVTVVHSAEDTAAWNATLDASGTDIRCRVTGAAATNIDWTSKLSFEVA